jgi:hypothetical protein
LSEDIFVAGQTLWMFAGNIALDAMAGRGFATLP